MSKYRNKSRRPPGKRHKKIPNWDKEKVIMLRYAGHTLNDIAKKTNFSYQTVEHILRNQDKDPDMVVRARAAAIRLAAGSILEKSMVALEQITPESLTHDRIEVRDEEGNLKAVNHSGPNGAQIATAYGILRDKADKLLNDADELEARDNRQQLAPGQMKDMLTQLSDRIGRLQAVSADIDLSKLTAKINMLGTSIHEEVDAEYEIVEDDAPE